MNGVEITNDMDITQQVVLGDVDDDGDLDLVAANFVQRSKLYLNNGTSDPFAGAMGQVITGPEARNTSSAALGDMNRDGRLDVLFGISGRENQLFLNNGTSIPFDGVIPFDLVTDASNTFSVAVGDADGDGDLDIVDGIVQAAKKLYLNNGTSNPFLGVIGSAVGPSLFEEISYQVGFGDMDGDGNLDLVSADQSLNFPYTLPSHVYFNNGTSDPFAGVAQSPVSAEFTRATALAIGDVDSDADKDIAVANFGERDRLYLNNGSADPFADGGGFDISSDETFEFSVAMADVNMDGRLDYVSGNGADSCRFYLNGGTPDPFVYPVGETILSDANFTQTLAAVDIDHDGDSDLVAGNFGHTNRLYLNNGSPHPFRDVTGSDITSDERNTSAVAFGDLDRDGDLDLVAGNFGQRNRLYLNNGTSDPFAGVSGSDITADERDTLAIALGDLNRDGILDLVVGNFGQPTRIYLGDGTSDPFGSSIGSDVSSDAFATRSIALGDVNRDGKPDIVAGNQNQPNRLYLNNGTGNPFSGVSGTDITPDADNTISVALADVNRDGSLDVVSGNSNQNNRIYLNNGTSAPFDGVSGQDIGSATSNTATVALADMDTDGDLDLIEGNRNQPNRLYVNNGSSNPFSGAVGEDITTDSDDTLSAVPVDLDGDGRLEVVAGNKFQPYRMYTRKNLCANRGIATSLEVDSQNAPIHEVVLRTTESTPPNTRIDYWLSNNNGTKWYLVQPDAPFIFPATGSELRWRAELHTLSPAIGPRIDELTLMVPKDSAVSESTLSFGQRDLDSGPTTPKTVTVTNVGFEDLTFLGSKAVITGVNADQFGLSPAPNLSTLAPGESVDIGVVFDPSDLGPLFAALEITTDDSADPIRSIPLGGTGILLPTPTPTATATPSLTPTPTQTSMATPSATLTVTPIDYDIHPEIPDGVVNAGDLLEWLSRLKDPQSDRTLFFDFARFWKSMVE